MQDLYKRPNSPYYYATLEDPRSPSGYVRRSTGCTSKRDAQQAAEILQQELNAEISSETSRAGLRFAEAAATLIRNGGLRQSTCASYASGAATVVRVLGDFLLVDFTAQTAMNFVQKRRREFVSNNSAPNAPAKPVTDASIRRGLSLISTTIRHAIEHQVDGAPAVNVMKAFDRSFLKEAKPTDRHLRPHQFQALLAALSNDEQRRIVTVLVGTGMRTSDLTGLVWGEVDFDQDLIEFGNQQFDREKRGASRRIPMLPPIRTALVDQQVSRGFDAPGGRHGRYPKPDELVFPSRTRGMKRRSFIGMIRNARSMAGVPNCRVHDLRHTFASWMLQQGVDPLAISSVLGHTTLSTTKRYARHVSDSVAAQIRGVSLRGLEKPESDE